MIRSVARALGRRRIFAALARRVLHHIDHAAFALSGRTIVGAVLPTLMLETTGRRSARMRRVPLLYVRDGERFVVIASSWGQRAHPGWSANLLAHADGRVLVDRRAYAVRAHLAAGEERARLWARMREMYPAYDRYRDWAAQREIRVFVLTPR